MAGRSACALAWGLAAVFLAAALVRAEDGRSTVPIVSRGDGTQAWVEISRSADGAKAVPVVFVPRAAVYEATRGTAERTARPEVPENAWNEIGRIVEHHRADVAASRPGAISLGAARNLVDEIREAVKNTKTAGPQVRDASAPDPRHLPGQR